MPWYQSEWEEMNLAYIEGIRERIKWIYQDACNGKLEIKFRAEIEAEEAYFNQMEEDGDGK